MDDLEIIDYCTETFKYLGQDCQSANIRQSFQRYVAEVNMSYCRACAQNSFFVIHFFDTWCMYRGAMQNFSIKWLRRHFLNPAIRYTWPRVVGPLFSL